MPKVSVIIPTYNRVKLLPEALDSVLNQTYRDFEIIIVDDGSMDNTKEIVESYINLQTRQPVNPLTIRYIYQENKGPAAARNTGIKQVRGEYIAFLDSDDSWLPEKLEKSINFITQNKFDWMCTAFYRVLELEGKLEQKVACVEDSYLDTSRQNLNLIKNGLFFFSDVPLFTSSILVRKFSFEKSGLFDETFKIGEDFDMFLRFEENNLLGGYLNEPLCTYRINGSSITQSENISGLKESLRLAKKHALLLGLQKQHIRKSYSEFLWRCADIFFGSGKYWDSLSCLIKSICFYPSLAKFKKIFRLLMGRVKISYENSN